MENELFTNLNRVNDPFLVCKEFFNSINNMFFLRTAGYLAQGISCGGEVGDCDFPDGLDEDEELFEGVRFRYYDDEVIVSDEDFKKYLVLACQRYVEINPSKALDVQKLLSLL